jgi:RND superfamily putative drug exporter
MAAFLQRLAQTAFHRRRLVLVTWLILIGVVAGLYIGVGSRINSEFTIPGSQSQTALDTLSNKLPAAAGTSAQIVFEAPAGAKVTNPTYHNAVESVLTRAKSAPQVAAVIDPFGARAISPDGRTALAQVQYTVTRPDLNPQSLPALRATTAPAKAAGLAVEVGGSAYNSPAKSGSSGEAFGVIIAFVILFVTFGSLLAAGMPLVTALSGITVAALGLYLVSNVTTVSSTAPSLALMIGLAVGIDYSVFIVSRYRSELAKGQTPERAVGVAAATAGSAVVFAGLTVFIALAGLTVIRIPFLTVMGLGAAATVAVAVAVALTLLPAILGFAGQRLTPKPRSRAARRERPDAVVMGERWARLVTGRPLLTVATTVVALLLLTIPALSLRLALADNGTAPPGSTQRSTYDTVAAEFGPGFNGPLTLLVQTHNAAERANAATKVAATVKQLPDVTAVTAPQYADDGVTTVMSVIPDSSPHDSATRDLVNSIRNQARALQASTSAQVSVTGPTAVQIDVSDRLSSSLLPFAGLVVGLALILLLIVFRSIVVPIKAACGFLLSIGATLGAVVAVFQWGWLANLFGVSVTAPVISFLPIILIAVLFGLAMDYEVFMVSRIREAYVETGQPTTAVIRGGRHAIRIVTAAALIMFSVFASFISTPDATLKTIAFGLAVGVTVDAFVVRMTFVPAVLALIGRRSWWLPTWLDRHVPHVNLEGTTTHTHQPHDEASNWPTEPDQAPTEREEAPV